MFFGISVYKMQERHDILAKTIGYLDKEQEALDKGYALLYGSFIMVFVGTLLEIVCFWFYNGSCHPFANILKDYSDEDQCKLIDYQSNFAILSQFVIPS